MVERARGRASVLLLENLRFHAEEEKNDPAFAGRARRAAPTSTSTTPSAPRTAPTPRPPGMAALVGERAAGFLLQTECDYLGKVMRNPERPLVAILGGAKVSDKILVIRSLLERVDTLLIGGAMAYTFLRAQGHRRRASRWSRTSIWRWRRRAAR